MAGTNVLRPAGVETMLPSEFEVSLEGPIDFAASLAIFQRSGDDMIDRYDGTWLVRTIRVDRRAVAYACRLAGDVERPRLRVTVGNVRDRDAVEQAVRMIFLPMPREFIELCRVDPLVGRLAQLYRGFRPVSSPICWKRWCAVSAPSRSI